MASVVSAEPPPPRSSSSGGDACLKLEALKCIDVTRLSQFELQALSLCSASSFDLRSTDDVVCPQLDRSLFNESAGSRIQTYSCLLHRTHFRLPGPHASLKPRNWELMDLTHIEVCCAVAHISRDGYFWFVQQYRKYTFEALLFICGT